jgi:photosystem II stability/assembly factor-like uncharacterized protein
MSRRMMYLALSFVVFVLFIIIAQRPGARIQTAQEAREPIALSDKCGFKEEKGKMDAPEEFERYHRDIRTQDGDAGPTYPMNYKMIEVNKAIDAKANSLFKYVGLPWVERGPGNFGGRTRGLIIDPDDQSKNTWFVGSVSGGVWKTTNAGASWANKTPLLPNLAAVTLAMAASNHNTIYAGTGEGFTNLDAVRGDGIWKSTDRGETWTQLSSTRSNSDFSYVNRVIVDPSNQNVVLAGTNAGIFRSTDGGTTWTNVYPGGGKIQQIVENPQNFNILYATRNLYGVLKSFDRGLTWTPVALGIGGGVIRSELAVSPVDTARLFLAVETSGAADLYVSDDGGAVWAKATQSSGTPPNWLGTQGWYDDAIIAHPYNRDVCFVGGIDIYKIQITGSVTQKPGILGVTQTNTTSFLSFENWGGPFLGGGFGTGKDFYGTTTSPISVQDTDYVSVEIRFGPGISQKAHRFKYAPGFLYPYVNYATVPFQAWDVKNNRQLMLSFLDSDSTGTFNLVEYNSSNLQREYIIVHAVPYDPNTPNSSIAATGGERYKNIYCIWPILPTGSTWDGNNLPTSNIKVTYGMLSGRNRTMTELTYGYPPSSYPYVHVDHHVFATIPVNQATQSFRIVNGSDGGIATSSDGGSSWTNPNVGYNTTQFYGIDKKPGASQYVGGTQDNGTWLSPTDPSATSTWTKVLSGDGFVGVWSYKDASKLMVSSQYNSLARSTNGGLSFSSATTDLVDVGSSSAPFVTRIEKSNSDTDLLFVLGSSGIWRSDNFGENWTLFRVNPSDWGFGNVVNAAISLADPQIVWAGVRMSTSGTTGKVHVSTDGGVSFSTTNNYGTTLGRLSGLATHPTQPKTAYALFSFSKFPKILRTTDLGQTWQDISGFASGSTTVSTNGFPDVATYCLLVMPHNPNEIWAGTEIGLFISTNNGGSWTYANDVIPAAAIWQLRAVDDEIVAATHGRGVWTVKIPALLSAPPPVVTLPPRLNKSGQRPDGALSVNISLRSSYDSTRVFVKGVNLVTLAANAVAKDTLIPYLVVKAESLTVSVTSYKNGKTYLSSPWGVNVILPQSARQSYVDNFNAATSNFTTSGFTLQTPSGFTSQAYHTSHPYSNSRTYSLTLNTPIIVQSTNAFVRFDEIALVEPGEPGSLYGNVDFYDYVVVEATKDGVNWIPVEDGYDARKYPEWLSAFNSATTPTASLIRKHEMNLLNRFSAGDVVFIRFRLWADEGTTGWGWMIDNLEIQASFVSVQGEKSGLPTRFSLSQNYPNPFNPTTTIRYEIPSESKVTLTIFDMLGRKIQTLVDQQLKPGFYAETWNGSSLASGAYYYRIDARDVKAGSGRMFSETKKLVLLK